MRHGKSFNHLSRKSAHRKALLANLASSLIMHKRIKTTTAKAKALRTFVEPIITRSKEDSTHSRRLAFSYLGNKQAVSELFREVSSKIGDRPGGYTRIMKIDYRSGDSADMSIIELVDYNENLLGEKETGKAKAGRKRRGKKKPAEIIAAGETVTATAEHEGAVDQEEEKTAEEVADSDKGEAEPESKKSKAGTEKTKKSKSPKAKAHKPDSDIKDAEDSPESKETKEEKNN